MDEVARVDTLGDVRVADFTWWGVGPLGTRMLADLGAEVIKIEHPRKFDWIRGMPPFKQGVIAPGRTRRLVAENPNLSGMFNNHNRSKLGITLDVADVDGRRVFEALVPHCDVVVESFSPHVFDQWGITYDYLRSLREDIILVRSSGLGHSGPDQGHKSAGPLVQALSGLTYLGALPGEEPAGWGMSYMDNTGGYYVTMAILQALLHRARTGLGQYVDVSLVDAGIGLLGPVLEEYQVLGLEPEAPGNSGGVPEAIPRGIYRCAGEDRWVAIEVLDAAGWKALCECIDGLQSLVDDGSLVSVEGRMRRRKEIDAVISDWCLAQDAEAVMDQLQRGGVAAGVVQNGRDLSLDPQLSHLGTFTTVEHPELGNAFIEGVGMSMTVSRAEPRFHGPLLGQHNTDIYCDLLGFSQEYIADLKERSVV